jgi:probable HAF family extracellular repeat protein
VGSASTAAIPQVAFLWEAGTGIQDLGTLGGGYTVALAINARGQIVGWSATDAASGGPLHAVLWERGSE